LVAPRELAGQGQEALGELLARRAVARLEAHEQLAILGLAFGTARRRRRPALHQIPLPSTSDSLFPTDATPNRSLSAHGAWEPCSAAMTPPLLDSLKRAFAMFRKHQMTDWAAAMTYFLVMALFPGLLVAISLLGLFGGQGLVTDAVQYVRDAGAPSETVDAVEASLQTLVDTSNSKAGLGVIIGVALGLNGASGAFGAAGRALNKVYGVDEDRGFARKKASDIAWTLVVILLGAISLVSVFVGGDVAKDLFGTIGLGETAGAIWTYARWLVALAAMMVTFAVIYAFAPDLVERKFRWISPGSVLGVVVWLIASAGFFFYVSNFSNYGATYGAFAGAIILLLWLYLTSNVFLLGGELNGEIERAQIAGRGGPPPPTPPPSPDDPAPDPTAPSAARDAGEAKDAGPG
jgi:membrane protein